MMERIDQADYEHHRQYNRLNRTRFYKWLVVMLSGDVEVHMFAVKTKRDRESIAVKEVFKASVDGDVTWMRDLILMAMGGYTADWYREKLGRAYYQVWDRGRWASEPYKLTNKMWHINCPVINLGVLSASDRFRYCAYDEESGDILDYLKMYKDHPRIEFLSKAGVPHMAVKPSFVKQLETDKNFMRFFSKNLNEIKEERYGIDVIRKAYKLGITFSQAEAKIEARRFFREAYLPLCIDAQKALEYVRTLGFGTKGHYTCYLRNCQRLGLDLADTKTAFPKNFKRRDQIVRDQCGVLDRKERAELAAKMAEDLKRAADKFKALEKIRGKFVVRIPRNDDDFYREGKKLHHCIYTNNYAAKMARGECVIAFVRMAEKPNVPFVTVQFDTREKRIVQCYANKNSKPNEQVLKFVDSRFLNAARKAVAL